MDVKVYKESIHTARYSGNPLTEPVFQRLIIDSLVESEEYVERDSRHDYDPAYAMDTELLFEFLEQTQHDSMERLRSIYDGGYQATVLNVIDQEIRRHGLLQAIWDGVSLEGGVTLDLVEPRPSALFDKRASDLYQGNQLSVMEEVYHKPGERLDLVVFLNGLAIFTFELKCNTSGTGWDYRDAIEQYFGRDCKTRLLAPKVGALAHFAMDLENAYVCTTLRGRASTFLPFNQGVAEPGDAHATEPGNPHNPDGPDTAYVWEDILTKDRIFDLVYDFMFVSKKRDKRKKVVDETVIFPRYQQLRAVMRVSDDIMKNGTARDYLIEHSAGSGKTNTICWLAHKLSGMYQPGSDIPLFDKVIVITDRRVVDDQLQGAMLDMAKDSGIVRVMDEGKTSSDLGRALDSSYRIIVSTTQKFLYLKPGTFEESDKSFAVLIDEAHGSTSGKSMSAVDGVLAGGGEADADDSTLDDVQKFLRRDIKRSGKQANVTIVGFTATPTWKTLQQFGSIDQQGHRQAFDLYSMNQAIKEGFILDVLSNYTTYEAYCHVVKSIADDPELESAAAKRALAHLISVDTRTISGKLEVMVEHFTGTVKQTLGGHAKAMIVTSSREAAVRYFLAYEALRKENMRTLGDVRALVAFTDKVCIDGETYTEAGLNRFPEEKTADAFDNDNYKLLIVADKYQTGFDQKYLAAMYVDKPLHGIAAVQTLSRLNRICKPYDKRTFVLDFVNDFESIRDSFAPFYKTTVLEEPLTIADVRETERRMLEYGVLDADDVREFNVLLAKDSRTTKEKARMFALVEAAASGAKSRDEETADEIRRTVRNFVRQYAFLLQAAPFVDERMHMEYNFCVPLLRSLEAGTHGANNFDIDDKVRLDEFEVKKGEEHKDEGVTAAPAVTAPRGTGSGFTEKTYDRLSRIIDEWNARWGTHFDKKVVVPSAMALDNILKDDERVQQSAKVNSKADFRNTVDDRSEDALVRGYDQNEEWYGFLLSNEEARQQLFSVLVDDLYHSLHDAGKA